jgi:hypothetical protein
VTAEDTNANHVGNAPIRRTNHIANHLTLGAGKKKVLCGKTPKVMGGVQRSNLLYLLLVLALVPMVSIVGWFGATMTFPIEKK